MVHVDGVSTPADFLTKKCDQKKVDSSVRYVTNVAHAVPAR